MRAAPSRAGALTRPCQRTRQTDAGRDQRARGRMAGVYRPGLEAAATVSPPWHEQMFAYGPDG